MFSLHRWSRCFASLFLLIAFIAGTHADTPSRFDFVIPGLDHSDSPLSRADLLSAPAGKDGFVQARDGHFFVGDRRIRFWGVNLCFPANFPPKDVADDLAPHMAKLGINAVRFHHMDMQEAPSGIWAPMQPGETRRRFDPEMVDRLDYFLAKLAEHGIYADLNVHVSRTLTPAEGFPELSDVPWWAGFNKWVMYYDHDVQAAVKEYARNLLTHRNPYRDDLRRVDDPAIGLVEMLNENYFTVQGYNLYTRLPERFQKSFVAAWNDWLKESYGDSGTMWASWTERQPPLGETVVEVANLIANDESSMGSWRLTSGSEVLDRRFGANAPEALTSKHPNARAIRLTPRTAAEHDYRDQLMASGLTTMADEPMTLRYFVRSNAPRHYHVEISSSQGGEWRAVGIYDRLQSTPQWTEVIRTVVPQESIEGEVNFVFSFGDDTTPIEFAGMTLQRGTAAVQPDRSQRIEDGNVPIPNEQSPAAAHQDARQFMQDTEIRWVTEFKRFLTKDLGVKVPITASQVNYHVPEVNLRLNDFVDLHNYWHHPMFPSGGDWDPERWTVGNEPMEAFPTRSKWPTNSLLMRVGWRYANKPFTLSEWNYPEPSPYGAGAITTAAVLGAIQDWDGVFFFQYDSESKTREDWNRDHTTSFFSFNGSPVKLATMATAANIFLRGDLPPLAQTKLGPIEDPVSGEHGLRYRLAVSPEVSESPELPTIDANTLSTPTGSLRWHSDPEAEDFRGVIAIDTENTAGVWGTIGGEDHQAGPLSLAVDDIQPNYGSILASSLDGRGLTKSNTILMLAATSSENRSMGWNEDRTSVGTQWGTGPTTVAGMTADVRLQTGATTAKVHVCDGSGRPTKVVESRLENGVLKFSIRPEHQTLWYWIETK